VEGRIVGTAVATVALKPDIAEQMNQLAEAQESNVDAVVDKALRAYLNQYRREKIRAEAASFEEQKERLLAQYADHYIAMHNGRVIDHDVDLRTLHLRVFAHLGRTPVLLKWVSPDPERELVFRSPRFERGDM